MKNYLNKRNIITLVVMLVVFAVVQLLIQEKIITSYMRSNIYWIGIYIMLDLSINMIIGITGQLSLGHAGFMSIGAFSAAVALKSAPSLTGLFIGIGIGILISLVVSFIVAVPTLRLKGDYLAIATLGVA